MNKFLIFTGHIIAILLTLTGIIFIGCGLREIPGIHGPMLELQTEINMAHASGGRITIDHEQERIYGTEWIVQQRQHAVIEFLVLGMLFLVPAIAWGIRFKKKSKNQVSPSVSA